MTSPDTKSPADAAHALLKLTAQLSAALSVGEVTRLVATDAVDVLDATSAFVAIAEPDGSGLQMHAHARVEGSGPARLCFLDASEQLPVIDAWRRGEPCFVSDRDTMREQYPALVRPDHPRAAIAALPLDVDGHRIGAICVTWPRPQAFEDAQQTELVALAALCAQALRRARLAADVERMRRDFVVTASHELRTPLTAILGAATTLVEPLDLSDEARSGLAAVIVAESQRMRTVLDDLRVTTDIDSGASIDVRLQPVDVEPLLREFTCEWQRPDIEAPTICVDVSDRVVVLADQLRLRQVIAHLVDNACKYGPRSGTVRLRTIRVDDASVAIEVIDEGPGIDPGLRDRAFERFWRGDPLNRHGASGTGLGLHVAKLLVEAMGGTIAFDDLQGARPGACVRVTLPSFTA